MTPRVPQLHVRLQDPSTHLPGPGSGMRASLRRCSWLRPFPPPPPQLALCSAASSVLWAHPTSHQRRWRNFGFPSPPRPTLRCRALMRYPSSCARSFSACSGSTTARDRRKARDSALRRGAFRLTQQRRRPDPYYFAAQWLAYLPPVNASSAASRRHTHDSGPR